MVYIKYRHYRNIESSKDCIFKPFGYKHTYLIENKLSDTTITCSLIQKHSRKITHTKIEIRSFHAMLRSILIQAPTAWMNLSHGWSFSEKSWWGKMTHWLDVLFFYNLVRMFCLGGFAGSEPSLSIACCAGPDPTTRSRNSSAMAEFYPNV